MTTDHCPAPAVRPELIVVSPTVALSRSDRIRQLRETIAVLAREQALELVAAIGEVSRLASEIAALAPAYPPGVVTSAKDIAEANRLSVLQLKSLIERLM